MKNKYVEFVSDEHFLKAVHYVQVATQIESEKFSESYSIKEFSRSAVDPFKMLFDSYDIRETTEAWVKAEIERQLDKTLNNKIGEFHQILLGGTSGWQDLGVGHDSQVDLAKEDNSIFIELKNKHNTMNSSSAEKCGDKLMAALAINPNAKAYWGYIVPKSRNSGESNWSYKKDKKTISHPNLYKAWGSKVYEIVTGDAKNLKVTWEALKAYLIQNKSEKDIKINRDAIVNSCAQKIIKELADGEALEFFYKKTFA